MIFHVRGYIRSTCFLCRPPIYNVVFRVPSERCFRTLQTAPSSPDTFQFTGVGDGKENLERARYSDIDILVSKVPVGKSDSEVMWFLTHDQVCNDVLLSHDLVNNMLQRFKDDWQSAFGVFRWAQSRSDYKHSSELYDMMVDILGKAKQMDKLRLLLEEMHGTQLVTLNTVAKVMRRFAGAGKWEDAVRMFDELGNFGLEKNTESMNLLLDTLCKEQKVQEARAIFYKLKKHISPSAHTFNIFIHGWCKVRQVDEAYWTLQEMRGYGYRPCVISYSTIIQFYCCQSDFSKVYEMLDEMQAQGCTPNIVTYTTIVSFLAKSEQPEEALQIRERMRSCGCKPDTLFYNALIYALGRAGRLHDAISIFEVEMPKNGIRPNTSTFNTMISMFCHHSQEQNAFSYLKRIDSSDYCKPDVQTFFPLLKSCFRIGKTDILLSQLLNDMVEKHHLSLDVSTYTLLIHGLCRANKCEWAYLLFKEMISQGLSPRYRTCRLLLDELKDKCIFDAAESIEDVMKNCKLPG